MTNISIAAPLAQALASKGYDALTPVQDAMLAEAVAGRDLLVSAQTGSGKTVAFGLAIAPELLLGADQLLFADVPAALIIAPTRELALQVAREFEWLYEAASVKVATCVGGMDYRTEKRVLDRGAHVVVGTPGRLRDHIERGSLKLEQISAVVLDEADEMLDMGFEEDLKFILGSCPAERRTLMFSATVPKEIEAMARTYQQNALRIEVKSDTKQHADIEYQAISVAVRDREHAIFNLLRFHEAQASIVFCKTRANVNHLFARMTNRGLAAVALSGELSQSERTHALQSLRDGRAHVCVATDVAARGIDLPGLELVIHADLPGSSEILLHRSGRTGRAGKKGVSAMIVSPAEYKKAQRLLQGAKVVAEWIKPPSAEDVQARDDARLLDHPALSQALGEEADLARNLVETYGADNVAAAFIRQWREGRTAPEVLSDALAPPAPYVPRDRAEFGPSIWFELPVGHADRAEARWLLPKICDAAGITKDGIGAIRVQTDRTYVQILATLAGKFGAVTAIDSDLAMTKLDVAPADLDKPRVNSTTRPERAPRAEGKEYAPRAPRVVREKPAYAEKPAYSDKPAYVSAKPARVVEDGAADAPVADLTEAKPRWSAEDRAKKADDKAPRKTYEKPAYDRHASDRPAYEKPAYAKPAYEKLDKPAYGAKPAYAKPAARSSDDAPRKTWTPLPTDGAPKEARTPYAGKSDAARKPFVRRSEGDAKPYDRTKSYGDAKEGFKPRSAGFKSQGGAEGGAARATGYKSHSAGGDAAKPARAPYGDKPRTYEARPKTDGDSRPAKPYGAKSFGDKPARSGGFKSHGAGEATKSYAKPAGARVEAGDTSRRFMPPRKPKV
ncbi:MAG: DEAD/DEAH box helicase [Cypionkella sp.]